MGITTDVIGLEILLNARSTGMAAFKEAESWTTKLGQAAGFAAIGLGIGLGTALVASVKAAGDYQESTLALVHGAGELQSNLAMVRQGMLDMAGQVGISAQDLSKGMYLIESSGKHGSDALVVLRAAAEGARIGVASLETVADALTSVLNAYNIPASQAALVTSQMVAIVAQGKMHMQDLASSLSAVLPVAAAAHISFAQVGGALATMTAQGMSSQQATQDLADTIRHLQKPTQQQIQEWEALGLSTNDVTQNLGTRGLTGTLELLTSAITSHMGPAGTVVLSTFRQSQSAAKDLDVMISAMPPHMQELAHAYEQGKVSQAEWRKDMKALPADQAALMNQFTTLANKADGFNQLLRSGSPAAQTYSAALAAVTGDATGLNTTLMLTGPHMQTFKDNVTAVSTATTEGGGHVKNWSIVQQNFNFQMDRAKAAVESMSIEVGTALLPALTALAAVFVDKVIPGVTVASKWIGDHKTALGVLAAMITALLAPTIINLTVLWSVRMVAALAQSSASIAAQTVQMIINNSQIWGNIAAMVVQNTWTGAVTIAKWAQVTATELLTAAQLAGNGSIMVGIAGLILYNTWALVVRGATTAWTAMQWLLNVALTANPIGIVIVAIAALIAIIILVVLHWKEIVTWVTNAWMTFNKFLDGLGPFKYAFLALLGPIGAVIGIANYLTDNWSQVVAVFKEVVTWVQNAWSWLSKLAHDAAGFWAGIKGSLPGPVQDAMKVAGIPGFATGGIVMGPTLAMVGEAGPEAIIPLSRMRAAGSAGGTVSVTIDLRGAVISDDAGIRKLSEQIGQHIYGQMQLSGAGWH